MHTDGVQFWGATLGFDLGKNNICDQNLGSRPVQRREYIHPGAAKGVIYTRCCKGGESGSDNSMLQQRWCTRSCPRQTPFLKLDLLGFEMKPTAVSCLALKRAFQPGTRYIFFLLFRGERGCPWYGPSAPPGRHFAIRTSGYKRAFGAGTRYASLGLFLGILGATGRD